MYLREKFYDQLPPMPDAVSFDVTQAAQWFLRDDERIEYPWEEYGGLTPPYPELWMELTYPEQLRTGEGLMALPPFLEGAGLWLRTREIDAQQARSIRGRHYPFLQATLRAHTPGPAGNFVNVDGWQDCDTEPQWVVIGETYGAGRRRIAVFNRWVMTLDARGKYLRHLAQPVPWAPLALKWRCSQAEAQARYMLMGVAQRRALQEAMRDEFEQAFLFCLALMHCENVEEVELPPSPPVVRKRQNHSPARPRKPEIRYKTLTVTPPRRRSSGGRARTVRMAVGRPSPRRCTLCAGTSRTTASRGCLASIRGCTGGTARCAGRYVGVWWIRIIG